ncbi:PAAR domain-containing protein [Tritonibacter scottomollicae]|uniref:PAAR domain-containing protein n=1 Tax=Tritonibacter scottomollicae TaxID=483013 RepID=UPI003AA9E1CA
MRKGDASAPHAKPKHPPHGRALSVGSSSVFINGKPAGRVGDAIDCGGAIESGSDDVFIGG